MSAYRVANSLLKLREQVNQMAPHRSISDDGTIGDEAHQQRTSDHNPWVKDNGMGVVTGMDLTHDPHGGFDSYLFADTLRSHKDRRIKYVISNRRIWTPSIAPGWRPYHGSNPHDRHVHISVLPDKPFYDSTEDWVIGTQEPNPSAPVVEDRAKLRIGDAGPEVSYLQTLLGGVKVDGVFGKRTDAAVRDYQRRHKLIADGIVGSRTWDSLIGSQPTPTPTPGVMTNILATVFAGSAEVERSAYDEHRIAEDELAVALPARFDSPPRVRLTNPADGRTVVAKVEDVGPWNTKDRYWEIPGGRPQAESGTDLRGRRTNKAGIDVSPAVAKALGINGMGRIDWKFEPEGPEYASRE